jgi:NAD(P)H-hydrate epimerase
MAGAPALAAMAALRGGAGLVELVVPEPVLIIAASYDPCVMTRSLPAGRDGTFRATDVEGLLAEVARADAVAVGPGIGRSAATQAIVMALWRGVGVPAVFDADALWALAAEPGGPGTPGGPRVITPHAGEMLRLLGGDPRSPEADDRALLERGAVASAVAMNAVVVLKGAATLVTDGRRETRNTTGNPGMATAGTGDVLTGVTAALLAQGLPPFDAARLAVWVHGRAGDAAAADLGEVSMTARDLLDRLFVGFRAAATDGGGSRGPRAG